MPKVQGGVWGGSKSDSRGCGRHSYFSSEPTFLYLRFGFLRGRRWSGVCHYGARLLVPRLGGEWDACGGFLLVIFFSILTHGSPSFRFFLIRHPFFQMVFLFLLFLLLREPCLLRGLDPRLLDGLLTPLCGERVGIFLFPFFICGFFKLYLIAIHFPHRNSNRRNRTDYRYLAEKEAPDEPHCIFLKYAGIGCQ